MTTLPTRPALLLCSLLFLGSASAAPDVEPGLAIVVKPLVTAGQVSALEVRQQLTHGAPAGGALLRFNAPLALYGVPVLAEKITGLQVSDAQGALPLTTADDPKQPGYTTAYRHWQATRQAVYPVTVQYRIGTELVTQSGPPFGMKPSGGGVAGNGLGFLLLPENTSSTAAGR